MDGAINVLKPPGMTSHDVIRFLRRVFKQKRIGHAGTLDPEASGVLPVGLGKGTRLLEYLSGESKEYVALMTLGASTTTDDAWGETIEKKDATHITFEALLKAALEFRGNIRQAIPVYSAVKSEGEPLYKKARRGEYVEPRQRSVYIDDLSILKYEHPDVLFRVSCSKGTYVRALCRDLGAKLGTAAHMSFLLRTRVGQFAITDSYSLRDIETMKSRTVLPLASCLGNMPRIRLTDKDAGLIKHGRGVTIVTDKDEFAVQTNDAVALLDKSGDLLAIAAVKRNENGLLECIPKKVLSTE